MTDQKTEHQVIDEVIQLLFDGKKVDMMDYAPILNLERINIFQKVINRLNSEHPQEVEKLTHIVNGERIILFFEK